MSQSTRLITLDGFWCDTPLHGMTENNLFCLFDSKESLALVHPWYAFLLSSYFSSPRYYLLVGEWKPILRPWFTSHIVRKTSSCVMHVTLNPIPFHHSMAKTSRSISIQTHGSRCGINFPWQVKSDCEGNKSQTMEHKKQYDHYHRHHSKKELSLRDLVVCCIRCGAYK